MTFLPDTNTCISFLRQKQPRLIARWQSTKVTDIVLCSVGLMSFAVGQVGDGKSIATRKEVVHARHPQRLEIQKMAGVFLGRPLRGRSTDHHVARNAAEQLFQPSRSTPQADAQIGVLVDGNVELESPFKPGWTLTHAPRIGVSFRFSVMFLLYNGTLQRCLSIVPG